MKTEVLWCIYEVTRHGHDRFFSYSNGVEVIGSLYAYGLVTHSSDLELFTLIASKCGHVQRVWQPLLEQLPSQWTCRRILLVVSKSLPSQRQIKVILLCQ